MRVDLHAHFFPQSYFEKMAEVHPHLRQRMAQPIFRHASDLSFLLDQMAAADVGHALIGVGSHQPCHADEDRSVALARTCNDAFAQALTHHPHTLSALCCLPLPHVDAALREADRCLSELGFRGVVFGTKALDIPLDDPQFEPLWAELDRARAIVQIHPSEGSRESYGLGVAVMGPNQLCIACARLALSGVTTRYPAITFIAPCLGGGIPFYFNRIERFAQHDPLGKSFTEDGLDVGRALRRFYYDTESASAEALRCTCDIVGIDQVVFGTNHPFETIADDVNIILSSDLAATEKQAVLEANPMRLLGIADDGHRAK